MHAYLVHANIMVNVIQSRKGFNADAMEAMMDRPAPVCIVQFHLVFPQKYAYICRFDICFTFHRKSMHACTHACAVVHAFAHLHFVKIIIGDCYMRYDCFIRITGK